MAIITRRDPETPAISPLPGVRNTTQVSSAPASAMADAVRGIGDLATKHYEKKVEENNAAMLMGARRDFDEWENAQYDPENGAMKGYIGDKSLQAEKDMIPAARKRIDEIGSRLPPALQQRWGEIAFGVETQFGDRVRRTAYANHEAFQKFERESAVSSMVNSATVAVGSGDAATYGPKVEEAIAIVEGQLKTAFGANANVTEALRKQRSAIYANGIAQALARADLANAEAIFERHKGVMDADDITKATDALQPFRTERAADEEYARYLTAEPPAQVSGPARMPASAKAVQTQYAEIGDKHGFVTTSTTRSAEDNRRVGGVKSSQHLSARGTARDWSVRGKSQAQINAFVSDLRAAGYEVITKRHGTGPHIHAELPPSGRAGKAATAPATAAQRVADIRDRYRDNPTMRDALIRRVQQDDQLRRANEADLVDTAVERLASSDPWANPATIIPAAEREALQRAGRWESIVSHQESRQKSQVWEDDDATLGAISEAMEKNPTEWANNFDPTKYRHTLTQERISDLATQARNIRTGKAKESNFNYATENELLDSQVYARLGITGDTANAKRARQVFAGQWLKVKQSWARNNPGRKMTTEDMNTEILRLRTSFALHGINGVYESGKGKAKTTTRVDYAKTFGSAIPASEVKKIEAWYDSKGRIARPEDIRYWFLRGDYPGAN